MALILPVVEMHSEPVLIMAVPTAVHPLHHHWFACPVKKANVKTTKTVENVIERGRVVEDEDMRHLNKASAGASPFQLCPGSSVVTRRPSGEIPLPQ
ncbi:MAG: hypothetical protein RXR20_21070 [Paraburkholderia sp.]|jgi:hypothetical protein|uniref:hypothetical protein n=1 Tax=unclassified Paraburkholderia TaxID=2615204 RepID=UPI00286FFF23|nr:hypothetical protein [Paraburkholderia sp. USG1]